MAARRRSSNTTVTKKPAGRPPRLAIVVSRYNSSITDRLRAGAVDAAVRRTGDTPAVLEAPGAFELPVIADSAARSGRFDGVVVLGCLIRGETMHDRVIADSVANAVQNSMLHTGIPIAFGVLTVDNAEQARARAGGTHGNKGAEAVNALLDTIATLKGVQAGRESRIGRSLPDKSTNRPGRRKG